MCTKNPICPFGTFEESSIGDPVSFMRMAYNEAMKAWQEDEIPVGAVAVFEGKVMARTHNRVEQLKNAMAHAEMLVLREISQILDSWRLTGVTLYVTKEPCPMCAGAIFKSRVGKVFVGVSDLQQGCLGGRLDFNLDLALHHTLEVRYVPLGGACEDLIKTYFRLRRGEIS
jgi:tRNA(adenine34) deaminase